MAFFVFIFGLVFGSFFNVLIDRIPRGDKLTGRSYCESCKHALSPLDLIPLLSFSLLKGECRYCYAKLSWFYPVVELITGLAFVSLLITSSSPASLLLNLFFVSVLIVVFFTDLKYGIIPDKIIFPATVVAFIGLFITHQVSFNHILSAFGALAFFLFIFALTKGKGMGFGDVKFSFLLGLFLGYPLTVISLYLSCVLTVVVDIYETRIQIRIGPNRTVAFRIRS